MIALLLLWPGGPILSAQAPPPAIPALHASSLSGVPIHLPDALKGKTGVLVLGFEGAAQAQVSAWGRRLHDDFSRADDVVFYELPVIAAVPSLLRGVVLRSMRSAVPAVAQGRCVPVTGDEPVWRSVAGYTKPGDAYVLLVSGDGHILDRLHGDATDELYLRLKREIDDRRKSPTAPTAP